MLLGSEWVPAQHTSTPQRPRCECRVGASARPPAGSAWSPGVLIAIAGIAALFLSAAAVIDAARIPQERWASAGKSKGFWIAAIVVLTLGVFGPVLAVVYFASVRPAVLNAPDRRHLGGTTGAPF